MKKKIIVACGTGIATSTVVVKKLEEKLAATGIEYNIVQCKVTEVAAHLKDCDLVVTTTLLDGVSSDIPVVKAMSFLTGIGMEADLERIIEILKK